MAMLFAIYAASSRSLALSRLCFCCLVATVLLTASSLAHSQTKQIAFVTFFDLRDAEKAIHTLNGTALSGRTLEVIYSTPYVSNRITLTRFWVFVLAPVCVIRRSVRACR